MSRNIPFDSIVVGEELGPLESEITESDLLAYARDWDDPNPWYTGPSPWGGPVVPPAFNAGLSCFALLGSRYNARATAGVKSTHENLMAVTVPQKVTTRGVLADKYVKRGYEYVVVDSSSYNEQGTLYRRSSDHILLSFEKVSEAEQAPDGRKAIDRDGANEVSGTRSGELISGAQRGGVGTELPETHKVVYQRSLESTTFAEDSSHNDENARSFGYPGALVSAYVLCGLMSEPLVNYFGASWFTTGRLSVRFVGKGVQQGDRVTCGGVIRDAELFADGSRRLELELWMDKENGVRPVIGQASGILAAEPR